MNKTLLQIASFLLIPSLLVADPAMALGFAGVTQDTHLLECTVSNLEITHRLDQEALAEAALSSRGLARLVTVVPHGFRSLFSYLPADLKEILLSKSVRYSA